MANTKISALTANTNPTGNEELVYAYNNANGKMTLDTMKTFANTGQQAALVSGVNIKTINNTSILGSGNIDVSGGGGGSGPTELSGDANIWELSEGEYITTHKLFYKSGSRIMPQGQEENYKTYIHVIEDGATSDDKGYFAINIDNNFTYGETSMWFGSSTSSSIGTCYPITDCTYMLKYNNYSRIPQITGTSMKIGGGTLGYQCENNLSGSYTLNTLSINTYIGMEHYIFIPAQTNNYTIAADGSVDNPFNVTLPSNTNKACLIKFFCTGVSSMIITDCKIYS